MNDYLITCAILDSDASLQKLTQKTNSRQIIAMISLSDFCASLLDAQVKLIGYPENKRAFFVVSHIIVPTFSLGAVFFIQSIFTARNNNFHHSHILRLVSGIQEHTDTKLCSYPVHNLATYATKMFDTPGV